MPKHNPAQYTPYHEMIARRAHDIWASRGCPEGCDVEHWLEAEREIAAEARGQEVKARPAKAGRPTH